MRSVCFENIDNIKEELETGISVMYGAGSNGERLLKIFQEHCIPIHYFCDDDYNKWGSVFYGIQVISYKELTKLCQGEKVNVILTSVFAGPILGRLENIEVVVYEAFSILLDKYYRNSFYKISLSTDKMDDFQKGIQQVTDKMCDKLSKEILHKISDVVRASGQMQHSHFFDVASREDCYFIRQVLEALPKRPVIVDCGGFNGDLMVVLDQYGIDYDKVYSFEVNPELFHAMEKNVRKNSLQARFIPINKGVWEVSGKAYLDVEPDDVAGGKIGKETDGISVNVVTIDDYFANIKFDFVKMDIEGAELSAIRGGIASIKKYRPILAISLYHSIYDVVDIPLYLFNILEKYHYFIRHHSFIDSETVLYCIPDERGREED